MRIAILIMVLVVGIPLAVPQPPPKVSAIGFGSEKSYIALVSRKDGEIVPMCFGKVMDLVQVNQFDGFSEYHIETKDDKDRQYSAAVNLKLLPDGTLLVNTSSIFISSPLDEW